MPVPHSITSAALAGSAGVRSGRTCSIIETDKATGDKDHPCGRDGSYADVAAGRRQGGQVRPGRMALDAQAQANEHLKTATTMYRQMDMALLPGARRHGHADRPGLGPPLTERLRPSRALSSPSRHSRSSSCDEFCRRRNPSSRRSLNLSACRWAAARLPLCASRKTPRRR